MVCDRPFAGGETQNGVIPEMINALWSDDPYSVFVILKDRKNVTVSQAIDQVEMIQSRTDEAIETFIGSPDPQGTILLWKERGY
jgi:hypothetical protein